MFRILLTFLFAMATFGPDALAFDAEKELAELKILVFDSPHQAIDRAEKLAQEVGGSQAGRVWLQIKALQVLAMTKIERIADARTVATKTLEQGAWIDDKPSKFSLQLTQIDAGSTLEVMDWDKLAPGFDQLIEAIESNGADTLLARALTSYAAAASASGRPLLATGLMQKVMALLPRLEKDEFYYSILNDLVVTYQNVHAGGDLSTVVALAEEVRTFLKEHLRRFLGAEIMYNLAFAYMNSDDLPKALEAMREALRFGEALSDPTVTAYGWLGMANIQAHAEQYEEAEKNIREALKEFEKVGNKVRVDNALFVLIDILLRRSQIDEADLIIQRLEGSPRHLDKFKARVLSARGQYEKASQLSLARWQQSRDGGAKKDADSTQRMLMEFESSRQEMARLDLEEKEGLRRLKIEQDRKQEILKIWVLVSIGLISCSLVFDFIRVRRKTAEILSMHRRIREQVLGRFLSPELARAVANGQANFDEKPREAMVTLLFASFDGFKAGHQILPVAEELELLNEMAALMIQAIHAHSGTLDRCVGGRVMALFGAPITLDPAESARRSMRCLQAMHEGLQALNAKWQARLQRPLYLRAALHQGKVIIGSFGCSKRMDFTALGLPVQVADALESSALDGQCLLSESVLPFAKGWTTRDLGSQPIKGLTRPMRIVELVLDKASPVKAAAS